MYRSVSIQSADFDVTEQCSLLRSQSSQIGALAMFVGTVRDLNQQQTVNTLELEHYPGMTEKTLLNIIEQAEQRWSLLATSVIHRIGRLQVSDQIVFVGVASMHRGDAFAACEFIMDFLKTRAPFWKKEHGEQGGQWLDARESDYDAIKRW